MNSCDSLQRLNELTLISLLQQLVDEANKSSLKTIYSYNGPPTYSEEVVLFENMVAKNCLRFQVVKVFDDDFIPQNWDPESSLIHIPGAMSSALDAHLGAKVGAIHEFVVKGGRLLGWCGGAYWACRKVEYGADTSTKLVKIRDLALWKGTEIGPLLPFLGNPEGNIGFFHGTVRVKWMGSEAMKRLKPEGLELPVLLSGGGSFIPSEEDKYKVLATYVGEREERALAGVKTYVDRGISILMNPYFTHGADYFKRSLEGYEKHFPQHNWRQIVADLEEPCAELKRNICFVDMLLEAAQN